MKKQTPASNTSGAESLEKQALSQLNSGKYKEAIQLYKKLLHEEEKDQWHQQLAFCYLQRALDFATKGKFKEALVLWENHSQHCQPPYESYDHYTSWLLQINNPTKIQLCLEQLSAQQLDKQYPELAGLLGLLMITEHPEFEQALPQDSVFIAHFKIVQSALQAYQENNLDKLNETLKQLPYRSAFRDFRTLLKAVIAAPFSTEKTQLLLAKIPADSLYSQTAELLLACTHNGTALLQEVAQFNHKQRRIIGETKGFNKKQLEFIEQLTKHKDRFSDKIKFNLAIRYQLLCDSELVQRFCHAMLPAYPSGRRDFNKHFNLVNEFEENRLKALSCEHNNEGYDAEYYWKQCIKILAEGDADSSLKIALILRHLATQVEESEQTELLIESLQYDPDDRESYLQILRYYSQQQKTAQDYKKWLAKTIKKFPQDIDVLTLAVQAATRNKTYQKAIQYALKILKIDPLNIFAKQILFSSHLAHARQLLQGKKFHLVEKEIQQAEDMKIGKAHTLQTQLMQGFLCFSGQDKQLGLQQITASLNKLNNDPVNAYFQAAMEALLTSLPVATILRELPPAKDHLLSEQELTRFIQLLQQYNQEDSIQERLHKAIEKVKAALKKSLQHQDYDENLLLTLAQELDNIQHFELLRHCSKLAHSKWQKPIWIYYRVFSETNDTPEKCSFLNFLNLEKNHEQAKQDKDHRAMALIGKFLDRYHETHSQPGMGFLENLFETEEEDFEDPLSIFDHLPEEIFRKLQKKITSLMKKMSPEKLVQGFNDINDDNNVILGMSQDPDLFMALLIVRAAIDLGIDIDVSAKDVVERFGVNKKTSPFPF